MIFGLLGFTKKPGAVYKVAQDGFATYDVTYSGVPTGPFSYFQGTPSAEYPNTVLMSMSIVETGVQCGHVEMTLHYEGKDQLFSYPGSSTAQNIQIDFTTSQEPIESHPNFTTAIGGTPASPLNGAIFDATTGEFQGFPVMVGESLNPMRGVRSYIVPQEIATFTSVETQYPSEAEIQQIGNIQPPPFNVPDLPEGLNWLSTGVRVQNIGNVYFRTQRTFQLSGPRGWLPEIYS